MPQSNSGFWAEKVSRNRIRDLDTEAALLDAGWRVATVWECAVRGPKREARLGATVDTVSAWLGGTESRLVVPPEALH